MSVRLVETDPTLIIEGYRRRAEKYREMAQDGPSPDSFLRLAATFDSLAEGMEAILHTREAHAGSSPKEISN
jgi:hypothetical protein